MKESAQSTSVHAIRRWLSTVPAAVSLLAVLTLVTIVFPDTVPFMANAHGAESESQVRQRFVGDWELISFVRFPEQGGEVEMDYTGRLRYDENGYMMGLGMPRDLPLQAAGTTEQVTGGFAYWGSVSWDLANQRVIHHVEGSPGAAQWVGQDNIRYYEFDGDLLMLSLRDASGRVTATLTWRRQ